MTTADRTHRQSTTDHTTRPDRIQAVTRDLIADLDYYQDERRSDQMTQPKEWVTVKEAAKLVERSPRAVYNWINAGDLAVIRDSRNQILVLRKAVLRIVQEQRPGRPKGTPTRR